MIGRNIISKALLCSLFLIVSVGSVSAQNRHKRYQKTTKQPIFQVKDTLPVIGSMAKLGEKQMNKGLVNSDLSAMSRRVVGVHVVAGGQESMDMLESVRVRGNTSLTGGNDHLVIIDGV